MTWTDLATLAALGAALILAGRWLLHREIDRWSARRAKLWPNDHDDGGDR